MKKVAVINDLSGFGKCSLTAAIPVLSALGVTCCPLPTAVLSNQTGYSRYYCQDLTDIIPQYMSSWSANHASFDAIYTGFVTGARQLDMISDFLHAFLKEDTFLLVDPVMGDDGAVYSIFTEELLEKMRRLSMRASLITPNLTEAALLAGKSADAVWKYTSRHDLLAFAQELGEKLRQQAAVSQDVIITGIKSKEEKDPNIYNLAVSGDGHFVCQSHFFDRSFSGTGDLFASVLCGCKVQGMDTKQAMEVAGQFLLHGIEDTMKESLPVEEGILFEKHLCDLTGLF